MLWSVIQTKVALAKSDTMKQRINKNIHFSIFLAPGTTNYNQLTNKPQINGIELSGNKTLDDLGIQPKGDYITSDTEIPEVDNTLNVSGNAADAKVTGDKFDEIDEALENMSANLIEF